MLLLSTSVYLKCCFKEPLNDKFFTVGKLEVFLVLEMVTRAKYVVFYSDLSFVNTIFVCQIAMEISRFIN